MSIPFEKALRGSRAFALMSRDIKLGLSHAYMVISPDDDAVDSFFTLAAALIYCSNGNACMDCAPCRQVLHGNHADIAHFNINRTKIKVEDVSKGILADIDIKPLTDRKLYFVHRADLMLPAAQNKLLKTLEEPPEDVTIFLGVANESVMLETVRSRSHRIYLDAFDERTVYDELISGGLDERTAAIAAACSEGMLGKAKRIASDEEYLGLYDVALNLLRSLERSSDIVGLDAPLAQSKQLLPFLDVLSIVMRDMLVAKDDPDMLLSKHVAQDIIAISGGYSKQAIAKIILLINDLRKKLSLNVGAIAGIDSLLFSILEVKHKWQ